MKSVVTKKFFGNLKGLKIEAVRDPRVVAQNVSPLCQCQCRPPQ